MSRRCTSPGCWRRFDEVIYAVALSKTPWVTATGGWSYQIWLARPRHVHHVNKNDSERPSRQMRRGQCRSRYLHWQLRRSSRHTHQGQRLAALSRRAPTSLSHLSKCPTGLGPMQKWKDAFLAYWHTGGASNGPTVVNGIIEFGAWRTARGCRTPPTDNSECSSSQRPRTPLHPHQLWRAPICPLVDYLKTCLAVRALFSLCIKECSLLVVGYLLVK